MVFNREKYLEYLRSADWLIKKANYIKIFMENELKIECFSCAAKLNLQFHHLSYKNLYNESVDDLVILCEACHKVQQRASKENKTHFYREWKKLWREISKVRLRL